MNWKQIIRAAFELDEEEWDQAVKLRAMSEAERELLFQRLQPQKPTGKKTAKKAGKKSTRAAGMAAAISNSLQRGRGVVTGDDDNENKCHYELSYGPCLKSPDDNIHHMKGHSNYHPFTPAAQSAEPPPDQASSEIGSESVGVAVQGASGGN